IEYLRTPITPNDQFYVRYHLADIPEIKAEGYKIAVGGDGANGRAEITLDDLKKMPAMEVVAVNQCSGNRRGLSKPHVQGVEWGYGAMGCARWKGARLKDVLDKVGLKKEAIEIVFNGADGPTVDKTPDFIKSIPVWNRFISQETAANTPITEMVVNSLITSHRNGDKVKAGKVAISGMAWDGGYGIRTVQVSTDGGKTWGSATLGQDLGRFALRPWSFDLAARKGNNTVMVNATNKLG